MHHCIVAGEEGCTCVASVIVTLVREWCGSGADMLVYRRQAARCSFPNNSCWWFVLVVRSCRRCANSMARTATQGNDDGARWVRRRCRVGATADRRFHRQGVGNDDYALGMGTAAPGSGTGPVRRRRTAPQQPTATWVALFFVTRRGAGQVGGSRGMVENPDP